MTPADNHPNSDPGSPLSAEDQATPTRRQLRQQQERRSRRNSWIIFLSVLIVILAVVMFFVYSFSSSDNNGAEQPVHTTTRNSSHGLDDIIAIYVAPENFLAVDSLTNYTDAASPADTVECSTPHDAPLVVRRMHSHAMSYPAKEELLYSAET